MKIEDTENGFEIKGTQCGVRVTRRKNSSPLVQLLIEDDGNWIPKDFIIDSFWLFDLIGVLSLTEKTDTVRKANAETIEKIRKNL